MYHILPAQGQTQFVGCEHPEDSWGVRRFASGGKDLAATVFGAVGLRDPDGKVITGGAAAQVTSPVAQTVHRTSSSNPGTPS